MKSDIRIILNILWKNWITLFYFELFYIAAGYTAVFPLIRYLLSLLPALSGADYLSQENCMEILKHPLAVFLLMGILLLAGIFVAFELTALFLLCERGWNKEKISLFKLVTDSSATTFKLLIPRRIGVFLMLPALMFSTLSFISAYLGAFHFPEFAADFIRQNRLLSGISLGVYTGFHILVFLYLFGFPAILFEHMSFVESWKESLRLLQKRKLRAAAGVIVLAAFFSGLLLLSVCWGILLLGLFTRLFHDAIPGKQLLSYRILVWLKISGIAGDALMSAFLCASALFFYHKYREDVRPGISEERNGRKRFFLQAAGGVVLLCVFVYFIETEMGGMLVMRPEEAPMVIAHRAGAASAPENTLIALERAGRDGADGAEIDVWQLGDGTLAVLHDNSFRRTTGVELEVDKADFNILRDLNAGFYVEPEVFVPVPTLEDFLEAAAGKLKLMIELKSHGHERGLEEETLRLIRRSGMGRECMIASMDLNILRRVKNLMPDMETVYITTILITDQYDLGCVDAYSVETTSLSLGMVLQAHLQNRKVYGWTANTEFSVRKILRCGADGIITDKPSLAVHCVDNYGKNPLADEIAAIFYPD